MHKELNRTEIFSLNKPLLIFIRNYFLENPGNGICQSSTLSVKSAYVNRQTGVVSIIMLLCLIADPFF